MLKRIFAVALTLVMLLGMVPFAAFAAEERKSVDIVFKTVDENGDFNATIETVTLTLTDAQKKAEAITWDYIAGELKIVEGKITSEAYKDAMMANYSIVAPEWTTYDLTKTTDVFEKTIDVAVNADTYAEKITIQYVEYKTNSTGAYAKVDGNYVYEVVAETELTLPTWVKLAATTNIKDVYVNAKGEYVDSKATGAEHVVAWAMPDTVKADTNAPVKNADYTYGADYIVKVPVVSLDNQTVNFVYWYDLNKSGSAESVSDVSVGVETITVGGAAKTIAVDALTQIPENFELVLSETEKKTGLISIESKVTNWSLAGVGGEQTSYTNHVARQVKRPVEVNFVSGSTVLYTAEAEKFFNAKANNDVIALDDTLKALWNAQPSATNIKDYSFADKDGTEYAITGNKITVPMTTEKTIKVTVTYKHHETDATDNGCTTTWTTPDPTETVTVAKGTKALTAADLKFTGVPKDHTVASYSKWDIVMVHDASDPTKVAYAVTLYMEKTSYEAKVVFVENGVEIANAPKNVTVTLSKAAATAGKVAAADILGQADVVDALKDTNLKNYKVAAGDMKVNTLTDSGNKTKSYEVEIAMETTEVVFYIDIVDAINGEVIEQTAIKANPYTTYFTYANIKDGTALKAYAKDNTTTKTISQVDDKWILVGEGVTAKQYYKTSAIEDTYADVTNWTTLVMADAYKNESAVALAATPDTKNFMLGQEIVGNKLTIKVIPVEQIQLDIVSVTGDKNAAKFGTAFTTTTIDLYVHEDLATLELADLTALVGTVKDPTNHITWAVAGVETDGTHVPQIALLKKNETTGAMDRIANADLADIAVKSSDCVISTVAAKPATCTTNATKESMTCTCGHLSVTAETIPNTALGHKIVKVAEVKATHVNPVGQTAYEKCVREGCTYATTPKELKATCNNAVTTFPGVEATCTTEGKTAAAKCTDPNCEFNVESEVIPALGHKYELVARKAPTIAEAGHEAYLACIRCGELAENEEIVVLDKIVCNFSDVTADHNAEAIMFVANKGWMVGYPDGTFGVDKSITRAEAMVVVYAMMGRPTGAAASAFTDTAAWNQAAIDWAVANGFTAGMSTTEFGSSNVVKVQDMIVWLWRVAGSPAADTSILANYADAADINVYAQTAMAWAAKLGVLNIGADNMTGANNGANREKVAELIFNFYRLTK